MNRTSTQTNICKGLPKAKRECCVSEASDRLNFEVHSDESKDEALEILH